jgi:peptidoglycan hydrolase CwlO-like protein
LAVFWQFQELKKLNDKDLFTLMLNGKKNFFLSITLLLVVVVVRLLFPANFAQAETDQEKLDRLAKQIQEFQTEITRLSSQANTLSNQIAQYDIQIKLTALKIQETESEILQLGGRINQLEVSLNELTQAFTSRVVQSYKMIRLHEPLVTLVGSADLTSNFSNYQYLKKIEESDRKLLVRLENAQVNYKDEKISQENLQDELESQKKVLDGQKAAKAKLLATTKNDEKKFQQLLAQARAEMEAIQAIIAGGGQETEAGSVSEGARIANIIPSASPCSSGGHLHFAVASGGIYKNPADYLSPKTVTWDNSPDSSFSFNGSWQWPINDPIRITQGFGMTYYAAQLKYYGGNPHTGIDMLNANNDWMVKAVKSGTLYRGAIGCGGGTLRYVHVKQGDGIDTYYLHVNY